MFRPLGAVVLEQEEPPTTTSDYPPGFEYLASDMVYIPSGKFTMGCKTGRDTDCYDDEKPPHPVTVGSFYLARYEVTQAQWKAVMGTNPSYFKDCDNCPVELVNWDNVQGFIKKLNEKTGKNFRLPSEAEWEYAARGGSQSKGYNYAGSNDVGEVAWYTSNSDNKTHPVGKKKKNELGLYDMSGNVWEWCQDDWHGGHSGAPENGSAWVDSPRGDRRVNRGGSYFLVARNCRSSGRYFNSPGHRGINLGFRLALQ